MKPPETIAAVAWARPAPPAVVAVLWVPGLVGGDEGACQAVGDVVYTQLLNVQGGIEADVTVCRTGPDDFLLVTGAVSPVHDLHHIRRHAHGAARALLCLRAAVRPPRRIRRADATLLLPSACRP